MALQIPIANLPNQRLSVRLGAVVFDFWIRAAGALILADIVRDGAAIIQGQRVVPGAAIVPYAYLLPEGGNFYMLTEGDEYPDFELFGETNFLLYLTADELGN